MPHESASRDHTCILPSVEDCNAISEPNLVFALTFGRNRFIRVVLVTGSTSGCVESYSILVGRTDIHKANRSASQTENGVQGLITLLAGFAHFNLSAPFRLQDLRGGDATARIGIEDGIDDISTARPV